MQRAMHVSGIVLAAQCVNALAHRARPNAIGPEIASALLPAHVFVTTVVLTTVGICDFDTRQRSVSLCLKMSLLALVLHEFHGRLMFRPLYPVISAVILGAYALVVDVPTEYSCKDLLVPILAATSLSTVVYALLWRGLAT